MRVDANDLLLFTRIAEEGSFTKAADRLDIPASTLSRRIAAVEQQLGERLFIRTTRKMTITPFGQAILRHTQQIAAEITAIDALIEHRSIVPSGKLRVSLPGDFTQALISAFLADFIAEYPQITLDIDVSQRRVDLIAEGFDLALRIGALADDASLAARLLGHFELGLYAAPSYLYHAAKIRQPDDLLAHSLLRLHSDTSPLSLLSGQRHWQGELPTKTVANSPNILVNLALRGAGVTRIAAHSVQHYVESGELVRVLPEWQSKKRPVWIVFPATRLMPSRTRIFIDSLVSRFEQLS
ncbi:LysR family transcriptional regulator [Rosenbergiella epipactidis]|uniref:LysR family transcriptional regulator n=1 Tax=Rosenbergiella epipactidis TaxID=1544694 RepID=UPI001BDA2422|nr:LysR family transcriptional regulator [Rosenbergiella epipactidis]MBT0718442.1 LysR family transcriptional regulator [Rosenbergiella epipactidis]